MSLLEASQLFGLHRDTVRKMLAYSVPPGYRRQSAPRHPKIGSFTDMIDAILEADAPGSKEPTPYGQFERCGRSMGSTASSL